MMMTTKAVDHFLPDPGYVAPADRPRDVNRTDDSPSGLRHCVRVFYQHPSAWGLTAIALAALGIRLWLGAWTPWDVLPVVGLIAWWPFQEWLIHVYVLHFRPRRWLGATIDPFMARKHRRHHREPWKIDLVFMPLRALFTLPLVFAAFWLATMPTTALAMTGLTAHLLLGLHYEWVHYLTHTRYRPRGAWYRRLFRNHRLHHCKNEHYWNGVSMLAADWFLGTRPQPRAVPTSPTVRTLGLSDHQDIVTPV